MDYLKDSKMLLSLPVHAGWLPDHKPSARQVLLELPVVSLYPELQVKVTVLPTVVLETFLCPYSKELGVPQDPSNGNKKSNAIIRILIL